MAIVSRCRLDSSKQDVSREAQVKRWTRAGKEALVAGDAKRLGQSSKRRVNGETETQRPPRVTLLLQNAAGSNLCACGRGVIPGGIHDGYRLQRMRLIPLVR